MNSLQELLAPYSSEWIVGLACVQLIFAVWLLITWVKFKKIRRQQKRLLKGVSDQTLETLLTGYAERLQAAETTVAELSGLFEILDERLKQQKGRVSIVRYNALTEQGTNLSFSIAIVDEEKNGIVLSSIYGSEQSYIYAKPLENGASEYQLTQEEKKVIAMASEVKQEVYA
ncbi:DUF4446 family protein [Numidum massiliense]|uniref:DUF4446 family protein n=1 Tax=Numidum massiliense TaxID=1522315 RepID=UPI0006D549E3|nr:DUF4446 family protein [Numidum massiliense]